MNTIVFMQPTRIYIGDACEHALGGFCVQSGVAWPFLIPENLRGRAHINLLEFLIQVVTIWVDINSGNVKPLDCLLAMGDNTRTAAGWCHRTNFRETSESDRDWITTKQEVAQTLATLILDSEGVLYSQWFKGSWNLVTDSLGRDVHLFSIESHKIFLQKLLPLQLPPNFHIQQLPAIICSFITLTLQQLLVKKQQLKPLARGNLGSLSSSELDSQDPYIWMDSTISRKILSCLPLLKPLEQVPSLQDITSIWSKAQSTPPSHMWLRPSVQTTGVTQDWTQTIRPVSS